LEISPCNWWSQLLRPRCRLAVDLFAAGASLRALALPLMVADASSTTRAVPAPLALTPEEEEV
jgi:hypothetical protein